MCGIAGYFGRPETGPAPHALLNSMIGAVRHRGPDGAGVHAEDGVGLAHARLSIIDLSGGAQPMESADGGLVITFNGEIFNYVELRAELVAKGYRFRTQSDTEVILNLYAELGPDCLERLNGDFAFGLWDRRRKRLLLARDRAGVRPLYYTSHKGSLYFASEVKALLAVTGIAAELDPIALDQIFTFWFPLAPRTAFKGISELPPGHLLIVGAGGTTKRRYWSHQFPDAGDAAAFDQRPERRIAEDLRALLDDATRIRLRADVTVGSYLSGGLDSSLVTALARGHVGAGLDTFSVRFESAEYDEGPAQDEMVAALGTRHRSVAATVADIGNAFPAVVRAAEAPILRTSPAPLLRLSRLVRDSGIKVVLTGEGADEVFAGYDIFKEAKVRRFIARRPESAWRPLLLQRLYPYLPRLKGQSSSYLRGFFGQNAGATTDPLYSHLPRFGTTAGAKVFFSDGVRSAVAGYDAIDDLRASLPADFGRWHPLNQAQYLEFTYLLPGYILSSQGDRVAMANAVEGRFPFLDPRVIDFATRIPPQLKIRGLREKHILREAAKGVLPATIAGRVKQPYRAPETRPFVGPTAPAYVADLLSRGSIAAGGLFDPVAVERLAAKCERQPDLGFRDNMAFLGVLSTQLWLQTFAPKAEHGRSAVAA